MTTTTGYETVLAAVEARLTIPTDFVSGTYGTRRGHLTAIPIAYAPGAHIVGGNDEPAPANRNNCGGRKGYFTVAIFTRGKDGSAGADPFVVELYARMSAPFAAGVVVVPGRITREQEVADNDCARTDCEFAVTYPTTGEWSLEYAVP